jgi:hypothetical protein
VIGGCVFSRPLCEATCYRLCLLYAGVVLTWDYGDSVALLGSVSPAGRSIRSPIDEEYNDSQPKGRSEGPTARLSDHAEILQVAQ